jgi:hypothetical protein
MAQFQLIEVAPNEREVFAIWKDRFVDEYNRSDQFRQGHTLLKGVNKQNWLDGYTYGVPCQWIHNGKRTIGFVTCQSLAVGKDKESSQHMKIVCDVYVDPKSRGKGILAGALLDLREQGFLPILIDTKKFLDNCGYYSQLGFKYLMHWPEQELLVASPEPCVDATMWYELSPEGWEEQVKQLAGR